MPVKNFVFGAFEPTTNLDNVQTQMFAAHLYRNRLVEIERARRAAAEATIRQIHPEYAAAALVVDRADAAVVAAYDAVKQSRSAARRRLPATTEQLRAIEQAKLQKNIAIIAAADLKRDAYELLRERQQPFRDAAAQTVAARHIELQQQLRDLEQQPVSPEQEQLRAQIRRVLHQLRTETGRKKLRQTIYDTLIAPTGLDAGAIVCERDKKQARATCNCYWGTYLCIEEACSAINTGAPPRFKRYEGHGTIGVQFQGGLTVADATTASDTRMQIELSNEEELATRGKSSGLRCRGVVRLRIGSDGRSPIWTEFQVSFHRPLPRHGVIRYAYLHRDRIGTHNKWKLRLTIADPSPAAQPPTDGVAAVHPGWRMMPNGSLRVATIIDTTGHVEEFCLTPELLSRNEKVDSLQSIRDRTLNRRAPRLVAWIRTNAAILPEWLTAATETIAQWVAQSRFAALCVQWRNNRFPGDELAFSLFERWRQHDKHLFDWQSHQRARTIRQRQHLYRNLARQLASRYGTLIAPRIEWCELFKRPRVDEEIVQTDRQRRIAHFAAPAQLISYIREVAGQFTFVSPVHITDECHHCGRINEWDHRHREHTCDGCGRLWDQDHNAALIELARRAVPSADREPLANESTQDVTAENGAAATAADATGSRTTRRSRNNRRRAQLLEE
jgi:quinol monooxygenase YgiN